jgi:6-phosphofructokinase 1
MNSAVRAFVRLMTYSGHTVVGIEEGFEGLLLDRVREMGWHDVSEWASAGGSNLGTNRTEPTEETLPDIASKLSEHRIQGLLIIGGFDGFKSLVTLQKHRDSYPAFQIPLLGIAATVSNNVPGTDYSIGSDTALNTIVSMCDVLRQSANASRKRVFVVQTMGGFCGYLATMAGLAAGADTAYVFEEKFTISDMQKDVARLVGKFQQDGVERGIITRSEHRDSYPAFQIPLLGIAATVSNNVPGTDYSIGSDTALNTIVSMCDVLRQSANASRKRVFVVQTMGGFCGYLATMAGLAAGADTAYVFEEKFTISDMQKDVARLVGKFQQDGVERGIITRSERCSVNFTSEFMCQLLAEEGRGVFVTESNILGHLQQGDDPSPYDRILGTKYAAHAVDFFLEQLEACEVTEGGELRTTDPHSACMVGVRGNSHVITPIRDLIKDTDFAHRIPKHQWWMSLRGLLHVLGRDRNHVFLGEEHLKSITNSQ